jgi:hypothetical protein
MTAIDQVGGAIQSGSPSSGLPVTERHSDPPRYSGAESNR